MSEMPTDEKLIEWLRKINEHCKGKIDCDGCVFFNEIGCIPYSLGQKLANTPDLWNMEKIERIIRL